MVISFHQLSKRVAVSIHKSSVINWIEQRGGGGRGGGAIWGLGVLERSAMQEWNLWEVEVQEE